MSLNILERAINRFKASARLLQELTTNNLWGVGKGWGLDAAWVPAAGWGKAAAWAVVAGGDEAEGWAAVVAGGEAVGGEVDDLRVLFRT
jgi:hypothetical protein